LSRLVRAIHTIKGISASPPWCTTVQVGFKAKGAIVRVDGFFSVGVVLAFGSTQLKQFGAEVFVGDLLCGSILRELGILLTSIIVARAAHSVGVHHRRHRVDENARRN
jgi:phospholipid/cholesterol/gamma-HCH transport system permease protein